MNESKQTPYRGPTSDPKLYMGKNRPLRVYVAGASKEARRCRLMMEAVQRVGAVLTLDWLSEIEKEGAANEGLTHPKRQHYAAADMRAVLDADLLFLLAPTLPSTGAWTELGVALAANATRKRQIKIITAGDEVARSKSIFCSLGEEVEFDTQGIEMIIRYQQELGVHGLAHTGGKR